MDFQRLLSRYDYNFPAELIAQTPARPRDSAKLLIYNRRPGRTLFDTFKNLGKYLPKNAVLVFNQTRVVPARLAVIKETGGRAEILYLGRSGGLIKVLADRKLSMGSVLKIRSKPYFAVVRQHEQFYFLRPLFRAGRLPEVLQKFGKTPLPPYIKNPSLKESRLRTQYQSVFAKNGLSVAAPTASLHFTKTLISSLKRQGIGAEFITLNVNLGTFATLREENLKNRRLHTESYEITKPAAARINQARRQGRPIIAVGTTVVRTLESAAVNGRLSRLRGQTNLFIIGNYKFRMVDGIITNFHVPKSSLLMLVSAFAGRQKLLDIYKKAIQKNFRLFSFGDGMLII